MKAALWWAAGTLLCDVNTPAIARAFIAERNRRPATELELEIDFSGTGPSLASVAVQLSASQDATGGWVCCANVKLKEQANGTGFGLSLNVAIADALRRIADNIQRMPDPTKDEQW